MPNQISDQSLIRHKEIAMGSLFPYYRQRSNASEVDPPPRSHIVLPAATIATYHRDCQNSVLITRSSAEFGLHEHTARHDCGGELEFSASPEPPRLRLPHLQPDAKRTDGPDTKAGTRRQSIWQAIIPPTNSLIAPGLGVDFTTLAVTVPYVEELDCRSQQSHVDRMPSTVAANSHNRDCDNTESWTVKKRTAAFEADEVRLLWSSGRTNDEAAVPISRPTTRPMSKPQVKIPSGGPRPRNTLHNGSSAQRTNYHQAGRTKQKGGEPPRLLLQASRGDNVAQMPHAISPGEAWPVPSPKRQKISHQPSSPGSSTFTDELLDHLQPENVIFGPTQKSSRAASIQSINSQGAGFQKQRHGSLNGLSEHRNLDRMMNSKGPTKKQKRWEATQNQQRNRRLPISSESSSLSQSIDISGFDGEEDVAPSPSLIPSAPYHGSTKQPPPAINTVKSKVSVMVPPSSTGKTSPHFPQPSLPSKNQMNGTKGHQRALRGNQADSLVHSDRLDDRFVPVNGTRRSSDINMSSDADELQLGTTVGNNPDVKALSSINRSRNSSPSKGSSSMLNLKHLVEENAGLEPSNITPSKFQSAKPTARNDSIYSGPPVREKKAPWAVDVAAVNSEDLVARSGMGLVYDERMGSYVLKIDGQPMAIQVLPQKLQRIHWEDSGRRVRFTSSKIGTEENLVDLELKKEKDLSALVSRLGNQTACKIMSVSSEQMEKMFKKRRLDLKKSGVIDQLKPSDDVHIQYSKKSEKRREADRGNNPDVEQLRTERRNRSVVDELCARANLEDSFSGAQVANKPVPNGLPSEESISRVLERLKPVHNEHLRRSTRTSSEFNTPFSDLFSHLHDPPAVERYSKIHNLGDPWKKPLTYPKLGKKKITVEFSDLERLDEGEFLNDNLLSFYLRFLEHTLEEEKPNLAKRIYFFNTFFFATLMSTHKGRKGFNYEGVQKWTRNVDLFTYDYIVVPINEATHWYLAIICNLPALDRDFSLDESTSKVAAFPGEGKDPMQENRSSSSPTHDFPKAEPINVDKGKEPDERETRNSFAEMSLDAEAGGEDNTNSRATVSTNDNKEMLDVPPQDVMSPSMPGKAESRVTQLKQHANGAIEHLDEANKMDPKPRKGKRKSGPPAVTKTSPDKPVIITFDSLGLARSSTIRVLKDYLREEAKAKRGGMEFDPGQIKGITASQIPQQDNFYDCGVFLLGYVAKFLESDPKEFIAKIIRREFDETTDWPNLRPSTLRNSIRDQVLKLHKDQVAERQKAREAQKDGQQDVKQEQTSRSEPPHPITQGKTVNQEPQLPKGEAEEKALKAPPSAQPAIRQDALDTALSLDANDSQHDAEARKNNDESKRENEAGIQQIDREIKTQKKVEPSKPSAVRHEKGKQELPGSLENENSVILIASQSQPDDSAPKSFTNSHPPPPVHTHTHKSPDLPGEIQDSQPSQTSRAFADVMRSTSNEGDLPTSKQRKPSPEIPVVALENPKQAKRKKIGDDVEAVADASGKSKERDPGSSALGGRDNVSSKRKRSGRKATRNDEIINIDD